MTRRREPDRSYRPLRSPTAAETRPGRRHAGWLKVPQHRQSARRKGDWLVFDRRWRAVIAAEPTGRPPPPHRLLVAPAPSSPPSDLPGPSTSSRGQKHSGGSPHPAGQRPRSSRSKPRSFAGMIRDCWANLTIPPPGGPQPRPVRASARSGTPSRGRTRACGPPGSRWHTQAVNHPDHPTERTEP